MLGRNGNSREGVAAAEHLLAALLFASGRWYGSDPTIELMFRNTSKGALTSRRSYEVVNRDGWLRVRKSSRLLPDWTKPGLVRTRSPREALDAMAADSGGHLVKVAVECKDNSVFSNAQCQDSTFWDIKFERRTNTNNSNAVAAAAAARL